MARETKVQIETDNKDNKQKTIKKATSTKKTAKTKAVKDVPKTEVKSAKKTTKTTKTGKKATTTTSKKKSTAKNKATKKASSTVKKSTTRKTTTRKASNRKKVVKVEPVEYYDLPYRYNQTVVKVLAQTPSTLFIYCDISDSDRKNYEKKYGENFFNNTKPVLIVHNDTLNYSFEVDINDFANSWYLHIPDSKCDYRIELGRRPIVKTEKLQDDYIYVTTSNEMEAPNDKILFNKDQKMVYYKNVKTGSIIEKPINNLTFITNIGKIYDIYDLYREIYEDENVENIYDLKNRSSHPSS